MRAPCIIVSPLSLQLGESLVKKRHVASDEIRQVVTRLMSKWKGLLKASEDRGKGLGEVKDILEFNEQVDKVLDWIREKVGILLSLTAVYLKFTRKQEK